MINALVTYAEWSVIYDRALLFKDKYDTLLTVLTSSVTLNRIVMIYLLR